MKNRTDGGVEIIAEGEKEKLYLITARLRNLFGSTMVNPPSRFLTDIQASLVEYININDGGNINEEGIEIPFPHRTVYIREEKEWKK